MHARQEIKTIQCSNFPNAICIHVAKYISQINIYVFYYSEQFTADVTVISGRLPARQITRIG